MKKFDINIVHSQSNNKQIINLPLEKNKYILKNRAFSHTKKKSEYFKRTAIKEMILAKINNLIVRVSKKVP